MEEYGRWTPDWENEHQIKFCIIAVKNNLKIDDKIKIFELLSFPIPEMAKEFMEKHKGLLMDWFMIENK